MGLICQILAQLASSKAALIYQTQRMAAAAIYLASRAGDYAVGETIAVDGGAAYASLP